MPVKPSVREQRRKELSENYKKRRQQRRARAAKRPSLIDPDLHVNVAAAVARGEAVAIGYCRVSTDLQADSPDLQRASIAKYCELRGFTFAGVVTDVEVSGATPFAERAGGHVATACLAAGAKHIVATRLDRVFRSVTDCLAQVTAWEQQEVGLHLIDLGGQTFDTTAPLGRFFLTLMAAAAELERNLLRDRIRRALKDKRDRGFQSGMVPYGWRADENKRLHEHPQEQAIIKWVLEACRRGYNYNRIATELNARKDSLPPRGKQWYPNTIQRIVERAKDDGGVE